MKTMEEELVVLCWIELNGLQSQNLLMLGDLILKEILKNPNLNSKLILLIIESFINNLFEALLPKSNTLEYSMQLPYGMNFNWTRMERS